MEKSVIKGGKVTSFISRDYSRDFNFSVVRNTKLHNIVHWYKNKINKKLDLQIFERNFDSFSIECFYHKTCESLLPSKL